MKNIIKIKFIKFNTSEKRDSYGLSKYISEEKRIKINRFKSDADYNRSLYAEIIIRRFFIERFCLKNSKINMRYDNLGKPYVQNFPDIHFSISHSGNYIAVAFASEFIGIDIEKLKDFDYKGIANRYFEGFEKDYIFEIGDKNISLKRFYEIWTVKESYTKFRGVGLTKGLNHFNIENFSNKNTFCIKDKNSNEKYLAKSYEMDKNHIFSICSSDSDFDIVLEEVDISEINRLYKKQKKKNSQAGL